jgi:hypothetical protein
MNAFTNKQPAVPTQCWKCGDMDAMGHAKCDVPACGMKEQPEQVCPHGTDSACKECHEAAQPADHGDELTFAYLDGVHTGKQMAKGDLLKALEELLEVQDEPCVIDHQGYCQSHYLDNVNSHNGCRVANARALVAKVKGGAA